MSKKKGLNLKKITENGNSLKTDVKYDVRFHLKFYFKLAFLFKKKANLT